MDKDKFKEFEPSSPFGPPSYSGVYGVFEMNSETLEVKLHYIGSSKNIQKRVLNKKHPYIILFQEKELVFTRSFQCDDYVQKEIELIKKYKPRLNKLHNYYGEEKST
jgi:excinuclease UvrABC nuclease subunit